jgi:hypothetical protein
MSYFFSLPEEKKEKVVAKFFSKVDKNGPNGCWLWMGGLIAEGYGRLIVDGSAKNGKGAHMKAHRLSWEIQYKMPVPKGLLCCHSCDVKRCVNPAHIFIGTDKHNADDKRLKDKSYDRPLHIRIQMAQDYYHNGLSRAQIEEKYGTSAYKKLKDPAVLAAVEKTDVLHRLHPSLRKYIINKKG